MPFPSSVIKPVVALATMAVLVVAIACGSSEPPSLHDIAARACQDMSVVSGSDSWRTLNRAEERAKKAKYTDSDFNDALRELCLRTYSRYVDEQ